MLTKASAETLLRENADGNIALGNEVLSAFKKISVDAVWIKSDRYWRWRVLEDELGREQRGWRCIDQRRLHRWKLDNKNHTRPTAVNTYALRFFAAALAFIIGPAHANQKISPHAVMPITQKSYPKLYAAWGAAGVQRINELMPRAAQKAAASGECDKVDLVDISQSRSSPGKKIVFFVDCANTKRFYIEDTELSTVGVAQAQTAKMLALSDAQATNSCESAIRSQLTNPLTFNRKMGTISVYRAPTTANIVVQFTFEAKNNLGALLPSKAKCVISDRGIEEATIAKN